MPIDYTKRAPVAPAPTGKVSLTKSAPTVSLTKQGGATGVLRVNLNWNARPESAKKRGLFKSAGSSAIDLDLGCLYEYADGSKGVVQALGNSFRDDHSFGAEPICWLDGDDRSGTNSAGENLFVNLQHLAAIKRILIFAFIYEGVPNWAAADGVVTVFPAQGAPIEVRLDEHDDNSSMCAIAMLESMGNDLSVHREVRYIRGGQSALDRAYGWGMNWSRGRK